MKASVLPGVHPVVLKSNRPCGNVTPGTAVGGTGGDPGGAPMKAGVANVQPGPPPVKLAVIVPVPVADGPEKVFCVGVTVTVPDATLVPAGLVALTEHVYGVPLASPARASGEVVPVAVCGPGVHVSV